MAASSACQAPSLIDVCDNKSKDSPFLPSLGEETGRYAETEVALSRVTSAYRLSWRQWWFLCRHLAWSLLLIAPSTEEWRCFRATTWNGNSGNQMIVRPIGARGGGGNCTVPSPRRLFWYTAVTMELVCCRGAQTSQWLDTDRLPLFPASAGHSLPWQPIVWPPSTRAQWRPIGICSVSKCQ